MRLKNQVYSTGCMGLSAGPIGLEREAMRDRWALIYEDIERPFGLESLAAELQPAGVRIEHPERNAAVAIVSPSYGTDVSRRTLSTAVRLATEISFVFWWPDGMDTFCSIHLRSQLRTIAIGLPDHTTYPVQALALGKTLAAMAGVRLREGTLRGYVYDPDAASEVADWDELFFDGHLPRRYGNLGETWSWPRVVLAPSEMRPVFEGLKVVHQRGGMVAVGPFARRWRRK